MARRRLGKRMTEPVESESDHDDGQPSHPKQVIQLPKGIESRGWISEAEWTINIEQNSDVDRLRSPSVVSIFRVPNFLKESKKGEPYVPKIVSLGPYHHRSAQLPPMDNHKGRALRRMTTRFNINLAKDPKNMDFSNRAKNGILQHVNEIRNNYEEKIDCEAENLALMLSLDGCFILEILRTLGGDKLPVGEARNYYEPIFERNKIDYTGFDILNDILMLENQIPLIVLRKLLELELNSVDNVEKKLFEVLVKSPRSKFYPFKYDMSKWSWPQPQSQQQSQSQPQPQPQPQQQSQSEPRPQPDDQVQHLLGLLHALIVSPPCPDDGEHADQNDPKDPDKGANAERRIPRAVELRNAGIKFERCSGGIKKIKFEQKSATIYLPPIKITDHTEVLFRNLIALEVCRASTINYVTCYLSLMDELIDSEEDVVVLRKTQIVTNYLGSDAEVAELFNGLCNGVTASRKDAFQQLKRRVNEHYRSKFKVWSAELAKEHFSSPWRSLALLGAIAALLLTALQTFFTIYPIYK